MTKKKLITFRKNIFTKRKLFFKVFCKVLPLSAVSAFAFTIFHWNNQIYGLALYYEGKEIAIVESEETIEKASQMMKKTSHPKESEVTPTVSLPEYKLKVVDRPKCTCASEIKNKIISRSENEVVDAVGVYSDGKLISVLDDNVGAEKLLDSLLEDAKLGDSDADVKFTENVELVPGLYPSTDIKTTEELKENLTKGIVSQIEYKVKDTDTLESICKDFNVDLEKTVKLNKLENKEINVGDKLLMETMDFPVHIETQKFEENRNDIPYEIIREADDTQYEGWENKDIEGKNGTRVTLDKVTYINKCEANRKEISSEIMVEPINGHVYFGTKKRVDPPAVTPPEKNNKFIWPVPYTHNITSKFGAVDGAFRDKPHTGIDISCGGIRGQDIVAACGGTVEHAGNGSGYGNFVKISHNNGICTLYAHCEKLYVKPGQKVSAGQKIASVGNSGNSTGYHTHFEVMVNGERKNPLNYL